MSELPKMFPEWLDRLQIKYFNPVIRPLAGRIPGLALIKHTGRKSGRRFETPVTAYRKDNEVAIVLGHGMTDWARNAIAAGGPTSSFSVTKCTSSIPGSCTTGVRLRTCRRSRAVRLATSRCSSPT